MDLIYHPEHALDRLLAPPLRVLWEPFSRKNSHFWNYFDCEWPILEHEPLEVMPDENARERYVNRWSMFWATNFADPKVVVIEPVDHSERYQIGYFSQVGHLQKTVIQRCSVILSGQFGLLLTNRTVYVWAESFEDKRQIRLQTNDLATRKTLHPHIPLL